MKNYIQRILLMQNFRRGAIMTEFNKIGERIMPNPKSIMIDAIKYVRADTSELPGKIDDMKYCVVRTYSAGVHIGYVKEQGVNHPQEVVLINSRRLHYWNGACSLSQVAMDGVDSSSRITMTVPEITLTDAIEIIPCSVKATEYFQTAKAWKK